MEKQPGDFTDDGNTDVKGCEDATENPFDVFCLFCSYFEPIGEVTELGREFVQTDCCHRREDVSEGFLDRFQHRSDTLEDILDAIEECLAPTELLPARQNLVALLGRLTNKAVDGVGESSEQRTGLIEVAKDDRPSLGPPRTGRFLSGIDQLGEGLDLGGSIDGRLGLLLDGIDLSVAETLCGQLCSGEIPGKLLQGPG